MKNATLRHSPELVVKNVPSPHVSTQTRYCESKYSLYLQSLLGDNESSFTTLKIPKQLILDTPESKELQSQNQELKDKLTAANNKLEKLNNLARVRVHIITDDSWHMALLV